MNQPIPARLVPISQLSVLRPGILDLQYLIRHGPSDRHGDIDGLTLV